MKNKKRTNEEISDELPIDNKIINEVRNKRPRCYSEALVQVEESSQTKKLDFDKLVSATKTRNFVLDDGILV